MRPAKAYTVIRAGGPRNKSVNALVAGWARLKELSHASPRARMVPTSCLSLLCGSKEVAPGQDYVHPKVSWHCLWDGSSGSDIVSCNVLFPLAVREKRWIFNWGWQTAQLTSSVLIGTWYTRKWSLEENIKKAENNSYSKRKREEQLNCF